MSTSEQLARINPDSKPVLYLVLAVTTVIAAVAFVVSFAGLAAVSQWAQIPSRLSWALPVFIDGAILGFTIMILVFRARGESSIFAWIVLIAFTLISAAANGAHAYAEGQPGDWRTILGSGLAGLAPAGLAVFIHGIARLLVEAPPIAATKVLGPVRAKGAHGEIPYDTLNDEPNSTNSSAERYDHGEVESNRSSTSTESASRESKAGLPFSVSAASPGADNVAWTSSSFRKDRVQQVLMLSAQDKTQQEIAELVGVSRATVGRWIRTHKEKPERTAV